MNKDSGILIKSKMSGSRFAHLCPPPRTDPCVNDPITHGSDCKHGNICFNIRARGAASPLPRQIIINIITRHTHAGRALPGSSPNNRALRRACPPPTPRAGACARGRRRFRSRDNVNKHVDGGQTFVAPKHKQCNMAA